MPIPTLATQFGTQVPTNFIWDIQQLQEVDVNSPEFKEILVRLYQNVGLIATALNTKVTGKYPLQEFVNGKLYFPNINYSSATGNYPVERPTRQKLIYYTTDLPDTDTVAIPHYITITDTTTFTMIYATASDTSGDNYIPIPYASASGTANIEISVDATYVHITTASDRSNFNQTYIILEYLQT